MNTFCNRCGSMLAPGARFCKVCGAPAPVQQPVQQPAYQPQPQYQSQPAYQAQPGPAYQAQPQYQAQPAYQARPAYQPQPQQPRKFCMKCGAPLDPAMRFCKRCG
ncbi:MAG: zinc ribbon domain-containing protein, partial [Clostridia bacterium]|nr:zinc ribbon domain-containing protein [Clostridia bacterium]